MSNTLHNYRKSVAAAFAGMAFLTISAQGSDDLAGRLDAVEQRLNQQATVTVGRGGLSVESPDNLYRLRIRGYAQSDARFFADSTDAGTDQFLVRRARVIVKGRAGEWAEYRIMPEFGGSGFSIQDAHVDIAFHPAAKLRAGKFKAPISLERLQSGTALRLAERAYPSSLAPNRELGVQLYGSLLDRRLDYAAGVFNGAPDGGSVNGDADDKKDLIGRIFAHPFRGSDITALEGLGIGIAGSYGKRQGNLSNPQLAGVRTPGQNGFFSYLVAEELEDTVIADGTVARIAPQAYYYIGPFGLLGEYIKSSTEVRKGELTEDLSHQAWLITASWMLTGENNGFGGVNPSKPFNPSAGQWGAWELATRFSAFDADSKTFPDFANPNRSASKAESWAVGLNGYLTSNLKLSLTYEETDFSGGAVEGGDRDNEQVIISRLQVAF